MQCARHVRGPRSSTAAHPPRRLGPCRLPGGEGNPRCLGGRVQEQLHEGGLGAEWPLPHLYQVGQGCSGHASLDAPCTAARHNNNHEKSLPNHTLAAGHAPKSARARRRRPMPTAAMGRCTSPRAGAGCSTMPPRVKAFISPTPQTQQQRQGRARAPGARPSWAGKRAGRSPSTAAPLRPSRCCPACHAPAGRSSTLRPAMCTPLAQNLQ